MRCFYCPRPLYQMKVCFTHWRRFVLTVYGQEAVQAALKTAGAATAGTVTAQGSDAQGESKWQRTPGFYPLLASL